ncbi:MAG TPA: ATP-binding protein [Gemmatimonadaceae bacterium]|nr:ATP-binding protein [Gemmatimonadaceae bacterium]
MRVARNAAEAPARLTGDDLNGLLTSLAQAQSWTDAAHTLLRQLAQTAGARRALLLMIDGPAHRLKVTHVVGAPETLGADALIQLDENDHPLVVSAMSLEAVACRDAVLEHDGIPFAPWAAIPIPQPLHRDSLPRARDGELAFTGRFRDCGVMPVGTERRRRVGLSPFAVAVLESRVDPDTVEALAEMASVAGPIVSHIFSVEEQRRYADQLDRQTNLLTAIINALPDPIVITDTSNTIVVLNKRAEQLLGMRPDDSEGRRRAVEINNLLYSSFLSKAISPGGLGAGARELNLVDPTEGTDLLFEVLAHPLPVEMARRGSYLSVLRDVTDLKQAAHQLQRQFHRERLAEQHASRERDRLGLILQNVADPILVTDGKSNIILMNRQAEELFELTDATRRDQTIIQRVRNNDTKVTSFISDFALTNDRARRAQVSLVRPSTGAALPMEMVSGKIFDERGEPMAIVSVLHDRTKEVENERLYEELKRFSAELEDRVREATRDLEERNLRLQWQSQELEKAYRLKSEFLANMSHELRTPINALIGYTSLMLDRIYGDLTAKQEEGLHRIQVSSQHLLALINDILDLAKIEAGKMPVHLERLSLNDLLQDVAAQMEPMVRRKGLDFNVQLPAEPVQMETDRTKVRQIVLNLVSNAMKFTARGSVSIAARTDGQQVRIAVSDTGIGIRPQDLEVIFEEFRQVDQSRTREYGGTGLGLSITRKLIALLGGDIAVTSHYGRGSTFTVTLPLTSEALTSDEQVTRVALAPPPRT